MYILFVVLFTGVIGHADFEQSGPVCYNCSGINDVTDCNRVQRCNTGQVCFVERDSENSLKRNLGCRDTKFCTSTIPVILGKRDIHGQFKRSGHTTECLECCDTNLCNDMACPIIHSQQSTSSTTTAQSNPTTIPASTIPDQTDEKLSDWSPWTRCPFSCGQDGIQHRFRHCTSFLAEIQEQFCQGMKIDTKICHNHPCCVGPPVITFIDGDVKVNLGDFIRLRCNATHADALYWEGPKIVGQKFPANVEVVAGLNILVVNNIAHNNTGNYRCVAKNLCGTTVKYVNVDVIN